MRKDFAIIGLGSFGSQLCRELSAQGTDVIAVDKNEERVNAVADFVKLAYCCDSTRRSALEQLGLDNVDNVIVAIGDQLESVILTIILLKEIGVKRIIARAEDESIKRVLLHLGVDEVIDARELAVNSLTYRLLSRSVTQFFEIYEEYGVATLRYECATPSLTLAEMDLRNKRNLNVLLIRRKNVDIAPTHSDRFQPGDYVVVFGKKSAIKRMDQKI